MSDELKPLLAKLKVPADYARIQSITDDSVLARLKEWKCSADRILAKLQIILERTRSELSLTDEANVISATVSFDSQDPWVMPATRRKAQGAQGKVSLYGDPSPALLTHVLTHNVKPLFQLNPHPHLNASGRKPPRPAGGPMATHDFYDGQWWKTSPSAANLVFWCVLHMHKDSYETLWPLIIPPVMALLDDFEACYKLRGVEIVSEMLRHVPGQLLKRTGVDGLIRSVGLEILNFAENTKRS
ncbi:hypothetical protein H0H92_013307 [Tricholoma furcatifolium]|nr:hypothetical protein H0H92_013307 [Tricholoma furcatifolium]